MAELPTGWARVPVTGSYANLNGEELTGRVYFTSRQVVIIDDITIIPSSQFVDLVDGDIPAGFTLLATDDPELSQRGWTYTVVERFPGGRDPYDIFVPYDSAGIDLATVPTAVPPPDLVGTQGPPNVLTVGTVSKLATDAAPTFEIVGKSPRQVVNVGIPRGAAGPPGAGIQVLGVYDTAEDLIAAHPTGSIGDAYAVAGHLYVWNTDTSAWVDAGPFGGTGGGGGAVVSVFGRTGAVAATQDDYAYNQLSGLPTLGTAAATDASAYATAAQGSKADTAIQSVVQGANITVDNTDPRNPVVSASVTGGGGTVSSVGMSVPAWLTVTGSPVTSAGTLTLSATGAQAAKQFLATPNGATGAVALRAIVASDIPTLNQATTGNAGSATKLATARTIAGVSFDGTANIAIPYAGLTGLPTLGTAAATASTAYATAAQGAKADTAVQPGALATVATSGSYADLISKPTIPAAQVNSDWSAASGVTAILNKPTLGTAAATNASAYATAAQGTKADSAVQPGGLAAVATSGAYSDLSGKPAIPDATSIPTKDITGDYTLSDADAGYRLRVNSAVGVTITDPGTLTPGKVILVQQIGTGQVTVSGANVQSFAATTKTAGQRAMATIIVDSSTVTFVSGELAAS